MTKRKDTKHVMVDNAGARVWGDVGPINGCWGWVGDVGIVYKTEVHIDRMGSGYGDGLRVLMCSTIKVS